MLSSRDEFGLPKFSKGNGSGVNDSQGGKFADGMFVNGSVKGCGLKFPKVNSNAHQVLEKLSDNAKAGCSGLKNAQGIERIVDEFPPLSSKFTSADKTTNDVPSLKPLWSSIVKDPPLQANKVQFEYYPRPEGITVVSPPVEILKEGNDKFKFCIVGKFSKGAKSYKSVVDFATRFWEKRGLLNVYQKDRYEFLFKFNSKEALNKVLAQGTWYIEGQPMILKAWGRASDVNTIPLWVKFSKVPDCYWTSKGLSWLGSTIGRPICADNLTSKLEVLPFAKLCVDYKIGDDLPDRIEVEVLDPVSEDITVEEVLVDYPFKPLVCSGCRSLGHKVGACPTTKRKWVVKDKSKAQSTQSDEVHNDTNNDDNNACEVQEHTVDNSVSADGTNVTETWVEVTRKNKQPCSILKTPVTHTAAPAIIDPSVSPDLDTPAAPVLFRNVVVDEIDEKIGKLSKSQRKKRKKAQGSASPLKS